MVTDKQRDLIARLEKLGVIGFERGLFGQIEISVVFGSCVGDLLRRVKDSQIVDNLHHAPACPANHYHKMRLVFQHCTCGANREMT